VSAVLGSAEFPLWGGRAQVAVLDADRLDEAVEIVRATVDAVDLACSSWREDSEIAVVNRAAGRQIAITPLLGRHLAAAVRAAELTGGAVDPTVGEALLACGFAGAAGEPSAGRIVAIPGYRTVAVDAEAGTLRTARGVRLDLGATAKALAADDAAAAVRERLGCGALVNLSGDLAIAGAAPAGGWRIRVTDDHRAGAEAPGQWIALRDGGLATSSTTVRRRQDGHHLIDPATGRPAQSRYRTVSVAAGSCLDANIASTAAIVLGDGGREWLQQTGLPARLVSLDGAVERLSGWPADGEDVGVAA
jgi:thiamine biosynthesis lipoprotein